MEGKSQGDVCVMWRGEGWVGSRENGSPKAEEEEEGGEAEERGRDGGISDDDDDAADDDDAEADDDAADNASADDADEGDSEDGELDEEEGNEVEDSADESEGSVVAEEVAFSSPPSRGMWLRIGGEEEEDAFEGIRSEEEMGVDLLQSREAGWGLREEEGSRGVDARGKGTDASSESVPSLIFKLVDVE